MIPFIIQATNDFEADEEKRQWQVVKQFLAERENGAYEGVPNKIFQQQLKIGLMTQSQRLKYALQNPPTFRDSYGSIEFMPRGLHTVDDQGFEGQVIQKNEKPFFVRWAEEDPF